MTDQPTETPLKADPTKLAKYRAWLSAVAILGAVLFGMLGMGAFAISEGFSGDCAPEDAKRVVLTFSTIGLAFFGFAAATLFMAWRFRPGGD